jgi:hypothetical protein
MIELAPHATVQLGWSDGRKLQAGEKIEIISLKFGRLLIEVPPKPTARPSHNSM